MAASKSEVAQSSKKRFPQKSNGKSHQRCVLYESAFSATVCVETNDERNGVSKSDSLVACDTSTCISSVALQWLSNSCPSVIIWQVWRKTG